jgi:hypothetical protein
VKAFDCSFPEQAERISALYNEEEDALLLAMLGQEYLIRHGGIFLHGQQAPEVHASVINDYLSSSGTTMNLMPWRTIGDFTGQPSPDFRKRVELPVSNYAAEIITRSSILLPMLDAQATPISPPRHGCFFQIMRMNFCSFRVCTCWRKCSRTGC